MKRLALVLVSVLVCSFSIDSFAADQTRGKPAREEKGKAGKSRLRHVVAFKFKESASQTQIEDVVKAFAELKNSIRQIKQFEWGTNVSPEKHDKGFTHGFVLTFKSSQDRDDYLVHPEHKAFGKLVGPVLEDVFVIDYWAED